MERKVEVNGENFQKYLEIINNINTLLSEIQKDTGGIPSPIIYLSIQILKS